MPRMSACKGAFPLYFHGRTVVPTTTTLLLDAERHMIAPFIDKISQSTPCPTACFSASGPRLAPQIAHRSDGGYISLPVLYDIQVRARAIHVQHDTRGVYLEL